MTSLTIETRIVDRFPLSAGSDIENSGTGTMSRRQANAALLAGAALAAMAGLALSAQETMPLPAPRRTGGMPLMQAFQQRRSTREFALRSLPQQVVSDLLWAAFGINRPSGDRTAPYWRHIMVIDVYAAMADGVWLYDPKLACAAAASRAGHPRTDRDGRSSPLRRRWISSMSPTASGCRTSPRRAPALRFRRYRLHRPERLPVLRVGGPCDRLSRGGRLSEARHGHALPESAFVTFAQTVGYPKA